MVPSWIAFCASLLMGAIGATDTQESDDISAEKQLINRLMTSYQRMGISGRPVRNVSTTVQVVFGLGLIQMNLDEKDKILTMSMWTRYQWVDEYLTWQPEKYDNVTQIRVEPADVWIPDIELYNTADVDIPSRHALAVVSSSGLVNWFPHCIFRSACSIDVSNFPFDQQTCNLAFGSWTHNSHELDLNMASPGGIDLSTFQADHKESSAWDVLNITAARRLLPSEAEEPNFAVLTFEILLSRKLVFSTYILTLPCVFLASLTLVVFWLPPERPDRTALAMSTFSSFMVLLLILVEAAPPTASTIPKIGVYYCFNMVIIVMTIILSSLTINLSRGPKDGKSRLPKWLRVLTLRLLARILCFWHVQAEHVSRSNRGKTARKSSSATEQAQSLLQQQQRQQNNQHDYAHVRTHAQHWLSSTRDGPAQPCIGKASSAHPLEECLDSIRRTLERMEKHFVDKQPDVHSEAALALWEWKMAGMVLDRFFFICYIFLIVLSLIFFFPRPVSMYAH